MRIILSCLQKLKRHAIPAYDFWSHYFVQGMQDEGHEVVEIPNVDWAEGVTYPPGRQLDAWRTRTWEIVESFVRLELVRQPIHLFISYLYPAQVEVAAIRELQR